MSGENWVPAQACGVLLLCGGVRKGFAQGKVLELVFDLEEGGRTSAVTRGGCLYGVTILSINSIHGVSASELSAGDSLPSSSHRPGRQTPVSIPLGKSEVKWSVHGRGSK